jgi:hypothetical protein
MAISIHRWQSVRADTLPKTRITQRRVTSLSGFGGQGNYARARKVLEGAQEGAATRAASLEQREEARYVTHRAESPIAKCGRRRLTQGQNQDPSIEHRLSFKAGH